MVKFDETKMWKEISETPEIFKGIQEKNGKVMQALVAEVKAKAIKNITGVARGTSDHALIFFKYLMEVFSPIKVGLGACSTVTMYDGKVDFSDNLVIGVSQSGKAADVLAVLERANSQGAITISITNNTESPMAKVAKYHLFCGAGLEQSVAATKTFSAQCFLMLWLAGELSANNSIINAVKDLSSNISEGFNTIKEQAEKLSQNLEKITDGFVLARGISYAIALESTLKLQETCYILMKGYAESDFQHGPMAMVGKGTPVIIYIPTIGFVGEAAEKTHEANFIATIERLKGFGANIYVVSDSDKYADYAPTFNIGCNKSNCGEACEVKTYFRFALFAQMLACFTSCRRGNNPDSPRALNKITITK